MLNTTWSQFFGNQHATVNAQTAAMCEIKRAIKQAIMDENLAECQELLFDYVRCGNAAYKDICDILDKFGCDTKIISTDPEVAYNPWVWNRLIASIPSTGFSDYAKDFKQDILI